MLSFCVGLLTVLTMHVLKQFLFNRVRGLLASLSTEVNIIHGRVSRDRNAVIELREEKEIAGSFSSKCWNQGT